MARETIEETDVYTIQWDDDVGALVHKWDKYAAGDAFRQGCEALLDVVENRNASKLLIDSREISAVNDDDQQWMFEDWVPRTAEAGIEHTATVYQQSTIAEMNMKRIAETVEEFDDLGESHMTSDVTEAREWLADQ